MIIRDAEAVDLGAIVEIYNREVRESTSTFDTEIRGDEENREWFAGHRCDLYPLLVAETQGCIQGWACLSRWSPKSGYSRTAEASLFVAEAYRNRSLGRALLDALVLRARSAGHGVLLGRIEAENRASLRLVSQAGFRSVGVMHRVGEKFGRLLDVNLVELLL